MIVLNPFRMFLFHLPSNLFRIKYIMMPCEYFMTFFRRLSLFIFLFLRESFEFLLQNHLNSLENVFRILNS